MLDHVRQDLNYAARQLIHNRGLAAAAILMLALGIGANTAIFSVLDSVVANPTGFENPERTVSISEVKRDDPRVKDIASLARFALWKDRVGSVFDELAGWRFLYLNLSGQDQPEQVQGLTVSASFLPLMGAKFELGRNLLPNEEHASNEKVAVLTDGLWKQRFAGDPNIINTYIQIEGEPYRVVGVLSSVFHFIRVLDRPIDIYIPLVTDPDPSRTFDHNLFVYGRLKKGVSLEQASSELDSIYRDLDRQSPLSAGAWTVSVTSTDPHDSTILQRTAAYPLVLLLLASVGLVLLIACANVAGLLLARATFRQKEIALRSALGAGRLRLIRQMLTESALLAFIGGIAGIAVAAGGIRLLNTWLPDMVVRRIDDFRLDTSVSVFSVCITMTSAILFGILPALRSSRVSLSEAISQSGHHSSGVRTSRSRNILVISQITVSMLLLTSALLLVRSSVSLEHAPRGLDTTNVLTMQISIRTGKYPNASSVVHFYSDVLQRLRTIPGLVSASAVNWTPMSFQATVYSLHVTDAVRLSPDKPVPARYAVIDPDYFRTMKIPMLSGREFTEADADENRGVAIVSAAAARRFWPGADPIGRHIQPDFPNEKLFWVPESKNLPLAVIGVAADVRETGVQPPRIESPLVYLPYLQNPSAVMHLVVRTNSDPLRSANLVRSQVWKVDKDQPVTDVRTMQDVIDYRFASESVTADLVSTFAIAALVLTVLGIHGLLSYSVGQRRHELAIRIALGAERRDLAMNVVWNTLALAGYGIALGFILSFALRDLLAHSLYGVTASDPVTLIMVSALMTGTSLFAAYLPARKAMSVDPIISLRAE